MQTSQSKGLVALVVSSFMSIHCTAVQHAVRKSIAYQKSLDVLHTETIPGVGEYDVFVDTRTNKCAVDFTAEVGYSPSFFDPFQHPNSDHKKELLARYCP